MTGAAPGAVLRIVHYRDRDATEVRGGENDGRRLVNHNIVTSVSTVADWRAGETPRIAAAPPAGEGCAVLLQQGEAGPILGATACAAPGS